MAVKQAWTNPDGLRQVFGTSQARSATVGSPCTYGSFLHMNSLIRAGDLSLTGGQIDPDANSVIPVGAFIIRATVFVLETFVSPGLNGTLDLGLCNSDGSYTNLDEDGIDAAIAESALVAGSKIACDGAYIPVGTLKRTGADSYLSYDVDVSLFTAGKAEVVVEYYIPMDETMPDPV